MFVEKVKVLWAYILSLFTGVAIATMVTDRVNFFEEIMGIRETQFEQLYNHNETARLGQCITFKQSNGKTSAILYNTTTGKHYQAGFFQEYSIKDLRALCAHKPKQNNGTFNVIEARNTATADYRRYVDVGSLQADPANRDAIFQVASNFSTLEPVSISDYPEDGITKYIYDYTQGPFAAISAAPGLIYRMYYVFYNPQTNPTEWRQTKDHQINLLDATNIPTRNGYIVFDPHYLALQKSVSYDKIKIGYHADMQVTYGYLNNLSKHTVVDDPSQIINQVFTAAVDFGNTNYAWQHNATAQHIAQSILDAAYEGTLRSAIAHGKKKVFLTLIGGGVFQNKLSTIASALEKVQQLIKEYGLEVTLIIYDSNSPSIASHINEFRKRMQVCVEHAHGKYVMYGNK